MQTHLFENPTYTRNRIQKLLDYAELFDSHIQLVDDGCAEPGHDDKPVALANWNEQTHWNGEQHIVDNDIMPRIAKLLEKLGYVIEWGDEWFTCEGCYKAIRSQGDSYHWIPSYWYSDGCGVYCHECVKSNPVGYLEELSGNHNRCETLGIPLDKYGYRLYGGNYATGWHPGQDADPSEIAKELREQGIADFIFALDENSQFYCTFSVWIKQEDKQ